MSRLTMQLLQRDGPGRTVWTERFRRVTALLVGAHGTPRLGNYVDPVREIFYILLSAKTSDAQYRETYRRLNAQFPTLDALANATVAEIRSAIRSGGLANKRAGQVKRTAAMLVRLGGSGALRRMSERELFDLLTRLPGMGPKSALCVMMYSLKVDVLPVDVNVQRIAERLGALPRGLKHYQAQQRLPGLIPDGCSRALHIAMVAHGRAVCGPRNPKCGECCLKEMCAYGRAKEACDD